jgi:predicted phage terminase large subunit-like protein
MTQRESASNKFDEIKVAAERDLLTFIQLVAPKRLLGDIHKELITWWYRPGALKNQLVLLPRGHQKSTFIAYRVAWEITRNPAVTVMYLSATAGLAEQQLGLIKSILTSPVYRRYWPEMVHPDEGKRERWQMAAIAVDHPKRKEEQVRDPTVFAVGLTSNVVGWHCDIVCLDDVVVPDNAYTEEGREKVKMQYSLLNSIANPGAPIWLVGTRYHPSDLYQSLLEATVQRFDENGDPSEVVPMFEVFERQVEDRGDFTGEYLWPRVQRYDGQWFGFNREVLANIYAGYLDKTQFYAQYYNNPNVGEESGIRRDRFQYYERKSVKTEYGVTFVRGKKVNVFASIDFAFSLSSKADYTAIVVIGLDEDGNIYVLDIERFKTDKVSEYFERIRDLHVKWNFRKLRAEVTAAQQVIVRELKDQYIKPHGLALSVDEFRPSKQQGSKEERIKAILQPRYENQSIWHFTGGYTSALEDELLQAHPAHDDLKDALAAAVDVSVPPRGMGHRQRNEGNVIYSDRFGGIF